MEQKLDKIIFKAIHIMERVIAVICVAVLAVTLCVELYHLATEPLETASLSEILEQVLALVVGLEFVRLILAPTPANTVEVLTVALARYLVLNHEDAVRNIAYVACICGLIVIRHFCIVGRERAQEKIEVH